MRPGFALGLACLALLALAGAVAGAGPAGVQEEADTPNASAREVLSANETAVRMAGVVTVGETDVSGVVWVEYRERAAGGSWERTRPEKFTGDGNRTYWKLTFDLTGLQPGTVYEYRVVANTSNGSDAGQIRTVETDAGTETPPPCPSFRGAVALCTGTPTPTLTPPPTPGDHSPAPPDVQTLRQPAEEPGDWSSGVAPLLAWAAAVVVVAPLVLGGLLGLESLRRGGSE